MKGLLTFELTRSLINSTPNLIANTFHTCFFRITPGFLLVSRNAG